jgi:hypothetical protein
MKQDIYTWIFLTGWAIIIILIIIKEISHKRKKKYDLYSRNN